MEDELDVAYITENGDDEGDQCGEEFGYELTLKGKVAKFAGYSSDDTFATDVSVHCAASDLRSQTGCAIVWECYPPGWATEYTEEISE